MLWRTRRRRNVNTRWGFSDVPINDLVKQHAFTPDEIKLLVTAFEEALLELQLKDRDDPATLLVAKRIIALAQRGERDPIRLRDGAVAGI
jgi:hypothetical protein